MKNALIALIEIYQCWMREIWSSGFFPLVRSECRFHPSCSEYCIRILRQNSLAQAFPLCARRILSCYSL